MGFTYAETVGGLTLSEIAEAAGVSESTARKRLDELWKEELVESDNHRQGFGRGSRFTRYWLIPEAELVRRALAEAERLSDVAEAVNALRMLTGMTEKEAEAAVSYSGAVVELSSSYIMTALARAITGKIRSE